MPTGFGADQPCSARAIRARTPTQAMQSILPAFDDCRIFDVIPKTVAIAPGPNMSGIASGTKAILP